MKLLDPQERGAAVVTLAPFVAVLVVLRLSQRPDAEAWAAADPLLHALALGRGEWAIGLSAGICALALARLRPGMPAIRLALRQGLLGIAAAVVAIGVLRALVGPTLPSFIPPEESSAPGLLLGLSAGVLEEALFRVLLLPLLCAALLRGSRLGPVLAVVGTGLGFALSHEIAPHSFVARHFVTRVAIPGCAMSAAAFWPGTSFIVAAHCTAHLLIPLAW